MENEYYTGILQIRYIAINKKNYVCFLTLQVVMNYIYV